MTPETVIDIMQEGLRVALQLSLPPLGLALTIGLSVAILQAVTSIQEQTMVFIPKILATATALLIFIPWMIATLVDFTSRLIQMIPTVIH